MIEVFLSLLNVNLLAAALIAILSGILHGYTGFGAALFMVPLFTLLFGPVDAIILTVTIAFFGSIQLYPRAARNVQWPQLVPIIVAVIFSTPIGVYALFSLDADTIRRAMGVVVLLAALILLSGWVYSGSRGIVASMIVGGLSGAINGATGVGGPPLAIYFLSASSSPAVQRANIVVAVATIITISLISLIVADAVDGQALMRGLLLTPLYVAGTWLGSYLFTVAPQEYFRRAALWLLLVTGIGILFI